MIKFCFFIFLYRRDIKSFKDDIDSFKDEISILINNLNHKYESANGYYVMLKDSLGLNIFLSKLIFYFI